jgi:hypothetical protein
VTRRSSIDFRFVDYIPDELDDGTIYIAAEFGAVMHLCCDGCGEKVSTPLHPAQWTLTYDGQTISLAPSIGSFDLACGSHYWIRRNKVHWAGSMSRKAIEANAARDLEAAEQHFTPAAPQHRTLWRRLLGRR